MQQSLGKSLFERAPNHKRIAWAGMLSGLAIIVLAVYLFAIGHGSLLFMLAVFFMGVANVGWGVELLSGGSNALVGWLRVGRWTSAILASLLALVSLLLGITFVAIYGIVILVTGLLQTFEFAPNGPANKS